jgi:hypothetical protein
VLELCEVDPAPLAALKFAVEGPARGLAISSDGGMLAVAQGAGLHVFSLSALLEGSVTTLQPVYTIDVAPAALLSFQWNYSSDSQPTVASPMLMTLQRSGQLQIFGIHANSPLSSLNVAEAVTAAWTVDNQIILVGRKDGSIHAIYVDDAGRTSSTVPARCSSAFSSWQASVPECAVGWECFFVFPFRHDEVAVAWRCSDIHEFPPTCFSIFRRLADGNWRNSFLDCVCPPPDSEDLSNALDLSMQRYFAQYIPALDILLVGSTMGTWVDIIGRAANASLKPAATDSIGMYLYNQENDRRKLSLVECADSMAAGSSLCFGIAISTTSQHVWDAAHVQAPAGTQVPSLPLLYSMSSTGILCSHGLFSPLKPLPVRSTATAAVEYTPTLSGPAKLAPVNTSLVPLGNALASPRPVSGSQSAALSTTLPAATPASRSSTFPTTAFSTTTKSVAFPASAPALQASTAGFATPAPAFPKSTSSFPASSGGFPTSTGFPNSAAAAPGNTLAFPVKQDKLAAPKTEALAAVFPATPQTVPTEPMRATPAGTTTLQPNARGKEGNLHGTSAEIAGNTFAASMPAAALVKAQSVGSEAFSPVTAAAPRQAARDLPGVRGLSATSDTINARFQEIVSRVDKMFEITAQSSLQFPSEREQNDIQQNIQWLAAAKIGEMRHNALQVASNAAALQDTSSRLLETMEVHGKHVGYCSQRLLLPCATARVTLQWDQA